MYLISFMEAMLTIVLSGTGAWVWGLPSIFRYIIDIETLILLLIS